MLGIDTNVLVRFLVRDDETQCSLLWQHQTAEKLFRCVEVPFFLLRYVQE
jgi:predicted nucleic-acid-binding protein